MDIDQTKDTSIPHQLSSYIENAKNKYALYERGYANCLNIKIYLEKSSITQIPKYKTFIQYLDDRLKEDKSSIKSNALYDIFLTNNVLIAQVIHQICHDNNYEQHIEKFIFNQKLLVLKQKETTLFYPIESANNQYPIILKCRKSFFIMNTLPNSNKHKEFLFRFVKEIYVSYFESKRWITYHGNSVILPNRKAIIVLGKPKSGKTKLCAGLCLKAKSSYLSDDRVMIQYNQQTRMVPSTVDIDHETAYQLGIEKPLAYNDMHINIPRTQIPLALINTIQDFSEAPESSFHQEKLKTSIMHSRPINIGLIVHAKLNPTLSNQYSISKIPEQRATHLLNQYCVTREEIWRDQYMDRGYPSPLNVKSICTSQNEKLAKYICVIELEYGPKVDYKLIEKTFLKQTSQINT